MNKSELIALFAKLKLHPSRRLGQNFLVDSNLLSALVRDAELLPGEQVLEVGPGAGALTAALLAAGCIVTAIELDHRLAEYVADRFGATTPISACSKATPAGWTLTPSWAPSRIDASPTCPIHAVRRSWRPPLP